MQSATSRIAGIDPHFTFTGTYPMNNAALQYVHTFSANMVNELRLGTDLEHVKQLSTRANTTSPPPPSASTALSSPTARLGRRQRRASRSISISGLIGMGDGTAASNLDDSRT